MGLVALNRTRTRSDLALVAADGGGCVGLLMTAMFVISIVLRPQRRRLGLGLDSWNALVIYALGIWGLVVVSA
jgi:hypothetical protein